MRPALLALALAGALVFAVPGAAVPYDDGVCRTGAVGWASDPCAGRQWGLTKVRAPEAWRLSRGGGVVVAVVDTGADFRHPDLRPNLIAKAGSNLLRNTVKVLNAQGRGTDRGVARGICFAVRHGAKVINLSLGTDPLSQIVVAGEGDETSRAIAYAFSRGVAVVIAAGNDGFPACGFPGAREKALCVGATDRNDLKALYSNFGDTLGVVAPGGFSSPSCDSDADIWSTGWPVARHRCGGKAYQSLAGTSMATPHVAGVAALLVARLGRRATPTLVYERIRRTADDLGLPGPDALFGHGRVNALRALQG